MHSTAISTSIYDEVEFFQQYQKLRQNPHSLNELVEKQTMLAMLPPLAGKTLLDLGCGMGEHLTLYLEKNAKHVAGVDLSTAMLQIAQQNLAKFCRKSGRDPSTFRLYHKALEQLDTLALPPMDIITSSFAFHYIADFPALLQKIAHQLKNNGVLIFSQEHPIVSCHQTGQRWLKDENKNPIAYRLSHYRHEGERERNWFKKTFKTYHRTLSTIVNALIKSGFILEEMQEPMLQNTPEWQASFKDLAHRPVLLFIKARKNSLFPL